MGGAKQKWTAEEEEALRQGVEKHGTGKWKLIQRDPDFNHLLFNRSNVDLKDKWRNLVVGGQVPSSPVPPVPVSNKPKSSSNKPKPTAASTAAQQTNEHSVMILEAISALQGVDGVDITAIFDFIKPRHEISTSFRKLLCAKLRRLAQLDKIEKVGRQRYKIKRSSSFPTKTPPSVAAKTPPSYVTKTPSSFATKTPTPKQEDPAERLRPVQQSVSSLPAKEDLEQRTTRAIHETMEAEASWFLACDAMKDLKIAEKYLEENQTMLEVARDIYSRCSGGERVFLA